MTVGNFFLQRSDGHRPPLHLASPILRLVAPPASSAVEKTPPWRPWHLCLRSSRFEPSRQLPSRRPRRLRRRDRTLHARWLDSAPHIGRQIPLEHVCRERPWLLGHGVALGTRRTLGLVDPANAPLAPHRITRRVHHLLGFRTGNRGAPAARRNARRRSLCHLQRAGLRHGSLGRN